MHLPCIYFAWRRALPRLGYLEIFSSNFSKFQSNKTVGRKFTLKRYAGGVPAGMVGHRLILRRISTGFFIVARLLQLQLVFLPAAASLPILLIEGRRHVWYELVVRLMKMAGPTFIKLGQWAATRPDLLPPDLCRILGQLHSRAPEHSLSWTRNIIRKSFGVELEDVFETFDGDPIGSGSVAQVHRARTKDGQDVAVKVLHPDVSELFQVDLELLNLLANLVHRIPAFTWLHIPEELSYFRSAMQQQLDLRFEAYTLAVFRRNFSQSKSVSFPEPIASAREVLVESYEDGLPISFFTRNKSDDPVWPKMKNDVASCGLEAFLQMILWDNFVHADLHPGNMMVKFPDCPTGLPRTSEEACLAYSRGYKPVLVFIDTGLITELSSKDFTNFTDLFKALILRADGYLAGQLILERGPSFGSPDVIDPEGFCRGMESIVAPIFSHRSHTLIHLENFSISPLVFKTFDLVRGHHVRLEGAFTNLVMSLICVEGVGRELTPQLSLRPVLLSAGLQYLATNIAKTVTETVQPYI